MDLHNIQRWTLSRFRLPLTRPLTTCSSIAHREGLIVELETNDGHVGFGEASPLPGLHRITLETIQDQLVHALRQRDNSGLSPLGRFAIESALWRPPVKPIDVPINGLITGTNPIKQALNLRSLGYKAVKLKVGLRSIGDDISMVGAVSKTLGDSIALRLDANQAWSLEQATAFANGIDINRIDYLEEPLTNPGDLPDLVSQTSIRVAIDESVTYPLEPTAGVVAVVIKPTRWGVMTSLKLIENANLLDCTPVISSTFESGVGQYTLMALAATIGPNLVPQGLGCGQWLETDTINPAFPIDQAVLRWPLPHFGISTDHTVVCGHG